MGQPSCFRRVEWNHADSPTKMGWLGRLALPLRTAYLPAGTVFAGQVFVCVGDVSDFHGRGVEKQSSAAEAQGNGTEGERVGNWSGQQEISVGSLAAFECRNPGRVAGSRGRSSSHGAFFGGSLGQIFCGAVIAHLFFGNDLRIFGAESRENFSAVTDEHHAFLGQAFVVCFQLLGRRRLDRAVVPEEIKWRAVSLSGELETNRACGREGVIVLKCHGDFAIEGASVRGPGLYSNRRIQIE